MKRFVTVLCLGTLFTFSGGSATSAPTTVGKPIEQLTALMAKYLPGYTLRPEDRGGSSPTYVLLDPDNKPVPEVLDWQGLKGLTVTATDATYEYSGNPRLNALLRQRKVHITSAEQALEVERLAVGLCRDVSSLGGDWEFQAQVIPGGWLIKPKYVGPPAMVRFRGDVEVLVDAEHLFVELRERRASNKAPEATR